MCNIYHRLLSNIFDKQLDGDIYIYIYTHDLSSSHLCVEILQMPMPYAKGNHRNLAYEVSHINYGEPQKFRTHYQVLEASLHSSLT